MSTLPAFYVGPVPVYGRVILSPMDGYSDLPFRRICRDLGSAMSYTEFVNVDELHGKHGGAKRARKKLQFDPSEHPQMVFQVYGHVVERIVEKAQQIVEQYQPDILDINMGCYVKKISERGAGSGMLRFPNRIADLLSRLSATLPVPVTAKIRLGWDDDSRNYRQIARILEDNGASLIAVHGRTRAQGYTGRADWDAIAEVKQAVRIPVIGNGDVCTPADIARMRAHTSVDAVMIGRAAIGNPWIFSGLQRADVPFAEIVRVVRQHLALSLAFYGPELGLILFRKHVAGYVQGAPGEAFIRRRLLTCTSVDDFIATITAHEQAMGRLPMSASLPELALEGC